MDRELNLSLTAKEAGYVRLELSRLKSVRCVLIGQMANSAKRILRRLSCNSKGRLCMDKEREEIKDIADQIYWFLINEGQNYLYSVPLGQRMFFTAEDVRAIIKKHKDELLN